MHVRHLLTLPRLHLRLRPVDRIDLRTRSGEGAKKVIARPFIHLVKAVAVQIVQHRPIPGQRPLAREVTFDNRTAPTFDLFTLLRCDRASVDIGIGQLRPDRRALCFERVDFRHAGGNGIANLAEDLINVAKLRPQFLLHLTDSRFVIDR